MSIVFEPANEEITSLINQVMHEYHPDLIEAGVSIAAIVRTKFTVDDEEVPSLKLHGAYCYATIKIINRKQRTHVRHDAQIEIDGPVWKTLPAPTRKALIDHEITHIELKINRKTGDRKVDDLDRPMIACRPDDWLLTGFLEIVARHGKAAPEYSSISGIHAAILLAAEKVTQDFSAA